MEHGQFTIAERIDRIVVTFKAARTMADRLGYCPELIDYLESTDIYYRSVAYEGAAVAFTILDLRDEDGDMTRFNTLNRNEGLKHEIHAHIALGWATEELGLQCLRPGPAEKSQASHDGMGYYLGLFRRRLTVQSQSIPKHVFSCDMKGFDRGVGRSLWYISKGDLNVLLNMVRGFPAKRQANLWRGIGVAASFVGGCTDSQLMALWAAAGQFQRELSDGARRVAISRKKAGTPLHDVKRARAIWKIENQSIG